MFGPRAERAGGARAVARAAVLALALAVAGCASMRGALAPSPVGMPSGRDGWLVYTAGDLRFEAPAAWRSSGDPRHVSLEAPDGSGRLEVREVEERFATNAACLGAAEDTLRRNAEQLQRARLHPTTVAGRRGVVLEADQGSAGHGWAWGICDGTVQYRLFLSGSTPLSKEVLEAYRALLASARIGGEA